MSDRADHSTAALPKCVCVVVDVAVVVVLVLVLVV